VQGHCPQLGFSGRSKAAYIANKSLVGRQHSSERLVHKVLQRLQ
jgi:hypothetical protein